jgi:hypothetical protein
VKSEKYFSQDFSKVTNVAAISNRALSSNARTRLGNRGYNRRFGDFGKPLLLLAFHFRRLQLETADGRCRIVKHLENRVQPGQLQHVRHPL